MLPPLCEPTANTTLVYVNTIDADILLPLEEAFRSLKPFYGNVVDSTLHLKPYDFAIFVK